MSSRCTLVTLATSSGAPPGQIPGAANNLGPMTGPSKEHPPPKLCDPMPLGLERGSRPHQQANCVNNRHWALSTSTTLLQRAQQQFHVLLPGEVELFAVVFGVHGDGRQEVAPHLQLQSGARLRAPQTHKRYDELNGPVRKARIQNGEPDYASRNGARPLGGAIEVLSPFPVGRGCLPTKINSALRTNA